MSRPHHPALVFRTVGFIVLLAGLLRFWYLPSRSKHFNQQQAEYQNGQSDQFCDAFAGSDRIVVTIKTGASEATRRIPPQLSTSLRCAPNILIFSDMKQKLGDRDVYDSLETIAD